VIGARDGREPAAELESAREALRLSEARFRLFLSNIPGAVYRRSLDPEMTMVLVSDTIFELTGFSASNLIDNAQRSYASVVHPEDRERIAGEVLDAVADDRHYGLAYRIMRADGTEAWVGDRGQAVGSEDGGPVSLYGTISDIDARKKLEADHARMEIELRVAHKLEAVGQLASGIAHEINTPIQFIGDGVEFLKESFSDLERLLAAYRDAFATLTADPAQVELRQRLLQAEEEADFEYLQQRVPAACIRTLDGVERVTSIVRAMKEFAHPQSGQAPGDLNRGLATTLTVARNEYRYAAVVETEYGELPPIVCNLSELNQVFLNLIVNAAHAIEDTVGESGQLGTIRIRTACDGDHAVVAVTDSGSGIPPDIQTRIFDPFFTTKGVGRGSGQGLAIARAVVERHGGTLAFETSAAGTTFTIRVPIAGVKNPTDDET
jgi:PAS domain S-box-containing protein